MKKLTGKTFALLRDNAALAVEVTARLKAIVESNAAATAVQLIPGNADDVALAALKSVLPMVSQKLSVVFGVLGETDRNADAVEAIVIKLRELSPSLRGSIYLAFSAELNAALSDGKLSLAEAAALAQMVYTEMKDAKG